jgi:hypothetical protein
VTDTALSPARLLQFPAGARIEREGLLAVARSVVPLLEAALEEGNAELVRQVFGVLGAVAEGGDAEGRLAAIRIWDGELVKLAFPARDA